MPAELIRAQYLLDAAAIRERCENIFLAGLTDRLEHFSIHMQRLDDCIDVVESVTRAHYPDLDIPFHSRWRHLEHDGVSLVDDLCDGRGIHDSSERARIAFDVVVTSVLLDAGAGDQWIYSCNRTDQPLSRSEGLARASFDWFASGGFANDGESLRVDAERLTAVTPEQLEQAFQVSEHNPLIGVAGRVAILNRLGEALQAQPKVFGADTPRVGGLFDHFAAEYQNQPLAARHILRTLLLSLASIWPASSLVDGASLGDVWRHPYAGGQGSSAGWVPFHKLSQWLTYSLVEPLQHTGLTVTDLNELTGLPEYRNGGLFLDTNVLTPKDPDIYTIPLAVSDERVVEWRALTVILLDHVAEGLRARFGMDAQSLPLARVLQGGTWQAGRDLAAKARENGKPPLMLASEGTVF